MTAPRSFLDTIDDAQRRKVAGLVGLPFDADPKPKLSSTLDSLSAVVGGRPAAVINGTPPSDAMGGGEYRSRNLVSKGDTVYVDPSGNKLGAPQSYVLAHEMGHRLFDQNDPNRAPQYRVDGVRDPALVNMVKQIRRGPVDGDMASEHTAEAFANAYADATATIQRPAFHDARANPEETRQMLAWLVRQPLMAGRKAAQLASLAQKPDATATAIPRKP